jgi:hypothetical protein
MRQLRFGVGDQIDVEEACRGQMRCTIQRLRVALLRGQIQRRIEHEQIRRLDLLREPFRADQRFQ